MGFLDDAKAFLFGKSEDKTPPQPSQTTGNDTITGLRDYFGITQEEMNDLMRECGIPAGTENLTQEQAVRLHTAYYSPDDEESSPAMTQRPEISAPPAKKKPIKIQPSDIIRDYDHDYESAKQKYAGARLEFSGSVDVVRKDGDNNYAVELIPNDENFRGKIIMRFVNNMVNRLRHLRKGQQATIAGFMNGVELEYRNDRIITANSLIISTSVQKKYTGPHVFRTYPMTTIPEKEIPRSEIPEEGSSVFTEDGKEYILGEMLGSPGGEGTVYRVNVPGLAAKIYNEEHCTERRREKIRLMSASRLISDGICLPRETLYTRNHEFTGYIMQEAKGYDLVYLLREKEVFSKRFPNWKKSDMVQLAITILHKIQYLHNHDVLIGDINLLNMLFVSPDEVYFLDTDSYQFQGFPSPVGAVHFTAPELQGKDLATTLRTPGNENFAVAVLVFMLMMQGLSPYAHQGGTTPAENIKQGLFPFGVGEKKVSNVWNVQPTGSARFQWSHLMRGLKEAFWDTFHADGEHRPEGKRYTASELLGIMKKYSKSLPGMIDFDAQSGEVFPDRLKRSKNLNYKTCLHCGEEKPEHMFQNGSDICRVCNDRIRNEVYMTITCSDCGDTFNLTRGEYEYYTSKGLVLPKRCPKCRELKRGNSEWNL